MIRLLLVLSDSVCNAAKILNSVWLALQTRAILQNCTVSNLILLNLACPIYFFQVDIDISIFNLAMLSLILNAFFFHTQLPARPWGDLLLP